MRNGIIREAAAFHILGQMFCRQLAPGAGPNYSTTAVSGTTDLKGSASSSTDVTAQLNDGYKTLHSTTAKDSSLVHTTLRSKSTQPMAQLQRRQKMQTNITA